MHLAHHRRRHSEVLLSLIRLPESGIEPAEPEVAVRDERAHAELAGQRHRLAVAALRGFRRHLRFRLASTRAHTGENLRGVVYGLAEGQGFVDLSVVVQAGIIQHLMASKA